MKRFNRERHENTHVGFDNDWSSDRAMFDIDRSCTIHPHTLEYDVRSDALHGELSHERWLRFCCKATAGSATTSDRSHDSSTSNNVIMMRNGSNEKSWTCMQEP